MAAKGVVGKGKKGKEVHDKEEIRTERIVAETVRYRWIINNFSELNCKKLYSETFFVDKHPWRILMYPKGEGYKTKRLSMYMCVGESDTLPASYYTKPTSVSFTILHYQLQTRANARIDFIGNSNKTGGTKLFLRCWEHEPIID
ncbi:hypothetical protein PIB30_083921 [Stylosanthes scabra]|uniref:MATH domain-containing protein n=1 Tax=Stylosanthes scabra TaxID=79078 RepID=A0ABU6ZR48_9FABA|nr:hypothetical protein [Stylosanthes scabra]